ncbi:MAG: YwaF family protein [Acholeplasmataceae bacterium]|nr:YwaF family protein [Acholeplasmataceae bacterium]
MLNEKYNHQLSMFDGLHLLTLAFFLVVITLFFLFREKIKSERFEKGFRITLGLSLLIMETLFHIWIFSRGSYSLSMIPLTGFCAMTNWLTIFTLLTNKTQYFKYLIYYAITGAILSLVFVDISFAIPHFRYFHYFFVHFGFLLAALYYYFTNKITITHRDGLHASIALFIYTLLILIADLIVKENWFYLMENPLKELSDAFGLPLYTILWIIAVIIMTATWHFSLYYFQEKILLRSQKD